MPLPDGTRLPIEGAHLTIANYYLQRAAAHLLGGFKNPPGDDSNPMPNGWYGIQSMITYLNEAAYQLDNRAPYTPAHESGPETNVSDLLWTESELLLDHLEGSMKRDYEEAMESGTPPDELRDGWDLGSGEHYKDFAEKLSELSMSDLWENR